MWNNLFKALRELPAFAYNIILAVIAIVSGLLVKLIANLFHKYYAKKKITFSLFHSIVRRLNGPLTFFLPFVILNLFIPLMQLSKQAEIVVEKTLGVLIIASFAWLLIAIIKVAEDYISYAFNLNVENNLRERKIRTQLQFLKKIAITLILVLAIGAVLLSFNNLRRLGTGLLTGVGISGLIIGFAAQRSLANLLAGFQIAFTQPIRLDDVLVVEGEWGKVEEINLTYVVLHIWDERRLILPINYFIEKPFQNWTRTSAEILGTVFIYLDYKAPVEAIRTEFLRLLKTSDLWDKRVAVLQVTDAKEQTLEVRALMSAVNSGTAFDLRCFVREKLVSFVAEKYPEGLPKTRAIVNKNSDYLTTEISGAVSKA